MHVKCVFLQLVKRHDRPGRTPAQINNIITSVCLARGGEGRAINAIPRTTRMTWIGQYKDNMKEGKEGEGKRKNEDSAASDSDNNDEDEASSSGGSSGDVEVEGEGGGRGGGGKRAAKQGAKRPAKAPRLTPEERFLENLRKRQRGAPK